MNPHFLHASNPYTEALLIAGAIAIIIVTYLLFQ